MEDGKWVVYLYMYTEYSLSRYIVNGCNTTDAWPAEHTVLMLVLPCSPCNEYICVYVLSGFNVHICVCKYGKLLIHIYENYIIMYCTRCISSIDLYIMYITYKIIWGELFILLHIIMYRSSNHLQAI